MLGIIDLIFSFWGSILSLFAEVTLSYNGLSSTLLNILFAFMITGLVISIFWRGAKT